jgi:hypothetical protein
VRHQRGSETIQTRAKNSRSFVGKGEGVRDVVRSAYFEGGAIREVKGNKGQGLGEKNGASKGKLANCTKKPVQPESAMRRESAMRADKTECAEGQTGEMRGNGGGQRRRGGQWLRNREAMLVIRTARQKTERERLETEGRDV